jgi:2,4-dienoyl-CoA reductase (NADPH2)
MHTGLEEAPDGFARMAAFFAERARGGVGLIITGGISPNAEGGSGAKLSTPEEAAGHRIVTDAVHAADPEVKICMQILHSGSLAGTPACVAPSAVKSRIGRFVPNELDEAGIEKQIADFANCARLAREAGYDGVELIGSAGYLHLPGPQDEPAHRPLGRRMGEPDAFRDRDREARAHGDRA